MHDNKLAHKMPDSLPRPWCAALPALPALVLLAGCAPPLDTDKEVVGEARAEILSGLSGAVTAEITGLGDPGSQSESALALGTFNGSKFLVATYNDISGPGITQTAGNRTVCTGASQMGFAVSTDTGTTWGAPHKIAPPADQGIAVLWGDPAATVSRAHANFVFLSNLSAPLSKWDVDGCHDGPMDQGGPMGSVMGGACIARSSDGGQTFTIPAGYCISNQNHFYDGSAMISAPNGAIFAAFLDEDTARIDVWKAATETSPFVLLSGGSFANLPMESHPRLAFDSSNNLLVVAQDTSDRLWIDRRIGSSWEGPRWLGTPSHRDTIPFTSSNVRTGTEFSIATGTASANGDDGIRVAFSFKDVNDSNREHINVAFCHSDMSFCSPAWPTGWKWPPPGWPSNSGHQWNPAIAFSGGKWKLTFLSTENYLLGDDQLVLIGADLNVDGGGNRVLGNISLLTSSQTPCPSTVTNYWGDYDYLLPVGFESVTLRPRFLRAVSDSTGATCSPLAFDSSPVHMTSVRLF